MRYRSYVLAHIVHRYISLLFVIMLLLARLSFVANSLLNAVFTFTLLCRSTMSRTRSSITSPASFKNRWTGLKFIAICQYTILERFSSYRSPYPAPTCTSHLRTESFKFSNLAIHVITDCLLPIDNRGRLAWLCSSKDSISSSHHCFHATYSSIVFNRVACSIKSRSMLSFALTNDAMHLNLLILYLITWSRDICVTLCYIDNDDDVTARTCDMSYHRMFVKDLVTLHVLFSNVAFISNRIDDVTVKHAVTCRIEYNRISTIEIKNIYVYVHVYILRMRINKRNYIKKLQRKRKKS